MHSLRRFTDDRSGQMMLLTAFILVIGFVALAGMASRVAQLPDETRQALDRPDLNEITAVADAIDHILLRLEEETNPTVDLSTYMSELDDSLDYLITIEAARGIHLEFGSITCDDSGLDNIVTVPYTMTSFEVQVTMENTATVAAGLDLPCS